jgi:serine/threonine protein kinase
VAIKTIKPLLDSNEDIKEKFFHEGMMAYRLVHPNIVQTIACCKTPPYLCLGMREGGERGKEQRREEQGMRGEGRREEGGQSRKVIHFILELQSCSLSRVLKVYKSSFSTECILLMSLDILQGLSFANWARIRHRDLSSGNILISEDGILKISDFGVGKIVEDKFKDIEVSNTATIGAETIRAPECYVNFVGELISCDVWSFGVILSQILRHESVSELVYTEEFTGINSEDMAWFNNFLEENDGISYRGKILAFRNTALNEAPRDKVFFLLIIRECLHLTPERRISFLQLIKTLTGTGPTKDQILNARSEILSFLKVIDRNK